MFTFFQAYTKAAFGEGEGDIYLHDVQCIGTERNLNECCRDSWGHSTCRHHEDAGVACYNSTGGMSFSRFSLRYFFSQTGRDSLQIQQLMLNIQLTDYQLV